MDNPEQNFYIQYDKNSKFVIGQISQRGYDQLDDDQKKNYTHVLVPLEYLYGWGRWWNTVRYVDETLEFPKNWPEDQSKQINNLSSQLTQLQSEFKQMMNTKSNQSNK